MYSYANILKVSFFLLTSVALVLFPLVLSAHGDGASFEKEVDGYVVDIGYSPEEPYVGGAVSFDFGLLKDGSGVDFSDLWVRISKEEQTVFAGGIYNATFGGARLSATFPESGEYTVSARYQNEGEEIVSAEFPLQVEPLADSDSNGFGLMQIMYIVLGVIVGAVGVMFIKKK